MTFVGGYTETRQYNANRQMTQQTAVPVTGVGIDLSYSFGAGNNGRVATATDHVSGEVVTYTYDQLNRLTQAITNGGWGQSFSYDGFGNLLQQTRVQGTAPPSTSVTVDAATNRITTAGYGYDANGNVTQTPDGAVYGYDVANRLVTNGAAYNPRNQRVFDGNYFYCYGAQGELLGKYQAIWGNSSMGAATVLRLVGMPNLYFNGRALRLQGHGSGWVMTDRLGSVRANGNGERMSYYPYGGEVGAETGEGRVKFGNSGRASTAADAPSWCATPRSTPT